jgi:hypothetical protein
MGLMLALLDRGLADWLGDNTLAWAFRVAAGVAIGVPVYATLAHRLGVAEIGWSVRLVMGRVRREHRPGGNSEDAP